jgi:uncharacterized protein YndB with AHSA1/START domain
MTTFQREFEILTAATPAAVWQVLADVARWPEWNAGIEAITLHGAFASGSSFTMKVPEQPPFTSRLLAVQPEAGFTDETRLGDICVTVAHRIERAPGRATRIVYAATVTGPEAEEIGAMVTGDFPDVLKALAARAEVHRCDDVSLPS